MVSVVRSAFPCAKVEGGLGDASRLGVHEAQDDRHVGVRADAAGTSDVIRGCIPHLPSHRIARVTRPAVDGLKSSC
jgi:hypothetical protein